MKKGIKIIKVILVPVVIIGSIFSILIYGYDKRSKNIYVKEKKLKETKHGKQKTKKESI